MILALSSCGASAVLEISPGEAAQRLKKGDIGFILGTEVSRMPELSRLDPSAPFYAGLLTEAAGDRLRSARLFEAALTSPIVKVKKEAARKLIPALAELKDTAQAERILRLLQKNKSAAETELATLHGTALYVLGRYGEAAAQLRAGDPGESGDMAAWNRALFFLAGIMQRSPGLLPSQEVEPFLLDSPPGPAYRWAYEEILSNGEYAFSSADRTAAAGRLAVLSSAYTEALIHFDSIRTSQEALFFRYPAFLSDLGRAYAAVPSKRETGFSLFTGWESALRTGRNSPAQLGPAEQKTIRYTLLFYAGRIRRQQSRHGEAADFFTRALAIAPDAVQEDACIWYILSSAMTEKPETVPALIKTYASRWNQDDEFYDILDRLSTYLLTEKKWNDVADVFTAIRNSKDGATVARYAYLMGRAVSLGYVSGRGMNAAAYFTIAYEEGNASFYYRALAASYLGKTVIPAEENTGTGTGGRNGRGSAGNTAVQFPNGAELEFYVKFFDFGAGSSAMKYLRENMDRYTKYEMRTLAGTFAGAGRYLESIQIVGLYMRRDGYIMETEDLELYYPKPFSQLIEKHAQANGLHPQMFFGLIRTESAFIPDIASHAGAMGLAQLMPATAKEVAAVIKKRGGPDFAADGGIDLTDPEINVQMGAVYLKDLTDSLGSPMLALLAYNGGPARIRRFRRAAPSLPEDLFVETISITETRNYGKRVMAAAAAYGYLYYGMSMHEVVSSIFN
ncbi:MAG: lytic transglycosylase domain-containing protein [Spirochaetaceae bacterium]|nr:lytic transglycosylase domain-containing protein [Spirochaetaceae bacterium]